MIGFKAKLYRMRSLVVCLVLIGGCSVSIRLQRSGIASATLYIFNTDPPGRDPKAIYLVEGLVLPLNVGGAQLKPLANVSSGHYVVVSIPSGPQKLQVGESIVPLEPESGPTFNHRIAPVLSSGEPIYVEVTSPQAAENALTCMLIFNPRGCGQDKIYEISVAEAHQLTSQLSLQNP